MRYVLLIICLTSITFACPSTEPSVTKDKPVDSCAVARAAILNHDILGWVGFPTCDLTHWLGRPALDDPPQRSLGSTLSPAQFQLIEAEGYYRPMISFRDGQAILFDASTPQLKEGLSPILKALGTPAAQLNWWYGTLELPGGEWVYPQRGITLFIDGQKNERLLHIALYSPTTLSTWKATLRPHLRKRLHPKR